MTADLTPVQRELLTRIAAAEDGVLGAPAADKRTIAALIKRGFVISLPKADAPSQLLITAAGKTALGGEGPADRQEPDEPPPPPDPAPRSAKAAPTKGKLADLIALLRRPEGARIDEMMTATGWQAHSVRGAMSGALKKKLGLAILSEKKDGERVYRIAAQEPGAPAGADA